MAGSIEVAKLVTTLVADTAQFGTGMNDAVKIAALSAHAMTGHIDRIVAAVDRLGVQMKVPAVEAEKTTKAIDHGFKDTLSTVTSWGEKFKQAIVTQGLSLAIGAAKKLTGALMGMGRSLISTAKAAAPLPGIANAFNRNAQQFGFSLGALQKAAAGTVSNFELMRKSNLALTGAGQELGKEFGKNLPTLLEGARAAASATGQSVDFLFESLVTGVKRGSPMLIDNTGIVLRLGEANQALANKIGKTVESFTAQDKSIAILNATVEATQRLIAQTGGAGLTTAEKIASLGVTIKNFKDDVGVGLNPVLNQATGILLKLVNVVLPPLESLIVNKIAPAMSLMLDVVGGWVGGLEQANQATRQFVDFTEDELGNIVPVIEDVGGTATSTFVSKWSGMAKKALTWGIKVVTEFAAGMVQGAAQALTQAMQWIGGLLEGWLKGASPPKIMPNLDKWGEGAMNTYLHAMTQADFGILEGMQGPISTTLSRLVDAGAISQEGSVKLFRSLSEGVSKALVHFEKTGKVSEGIFTRLQKAGGAYGKDLAELARRQFKLAAATKAVKEAEEALEKARTAQKDAQDNISKLADEYNELLAAGADESILEAKRAEFLEAEKQLDLADDQALAAEEQATAAAEALSPLQEQVALQQKILDQMFKMTEPMSMMEEAMAKVKEGMAAMPALPTPAFEGEGIANSLAAVFEGAKGKIREKLAGLFAPVIEEWTKLKEGPLKELSETWETFTTTVRQFWDEKVQPVIDQIKEMIPEGTIGKIGELAGIVLVGAAAFGVLFAVATGVTAAISALLSPIGLLIVGIATLTIAWQNDWGGIQEKTKTAATWIKTAFGWIVEAAGKFATFWKENVQPVVELYINYIRTYFIPFMTAVVNLIGTLFVKALQLAWFQIAQKLMPAIESFRTLFKKVQEFMVKKGIKPFETLRNVLESVGTFLKNATDRLVKFIEKLKKFKIPKPIREGSPSPFERSLMGIRDTLDDISRHSLPVFSAQLGRMPQTALAGLGAGLGGDTNFNMEVNTRAETSTLLLDWETFRYLAQR